MIEAKANFWIEENGKVALSSWRVELLEAVRETGSISAAASKMGISYRRAWDKIHECEQRLGVKLIETQIGGSGGGGSRLTSAAEDTIQRFQTFTASLNKEMTAHFRGFFTGEKSSDSGSVF